MKAPIRLTLKDDTVITLNAVTWLWVGPEVLRTSGKKTWYECEIRLATAETIVAKGRHDYLVQCLLGLEPGVFPKWWPPRP
jgi:hypothetical protein